VHTRVGDLDQIEQLAAQYPTRERFITEMTLDPPQAAGDLAGAPHLDEDYLVLSTVHSAKGMEWNTVYILNVVDGSFPSEFAAGKTDLIDEERRLLYVAMTRAKDDLQLCVPLKFPITQQAPTGDKHVYGARSRFMSDKVLKTLKEAVYHGSSYKGDQLSNEDSATLDVSSTLRDMW
jgi:DNA helicase-2/ATP-dependent DNA helicase PcrA